RNMVSDDSFPHDVLELIGYLGENDDNAAHVRAIPGTGTKVPTWILGSSLYGAQLAAQLGLPYAFASHFAPAMLEEALFIYRQTFRPSQWLDAPYAMIGAGVCAADTDEDAHYLRTSQVQAFANLITGRPGKLPAPVDDLDQVVPAQIQAQVAQALSCSATGSLVSVKKQLEALIERYQPDEIILSGMIHNHPSRVRSFEIAAEALSDLCDHKAAA
ncbi:MAG: MsnO8 family LLM class oxidoreductase, partial [Proteobacteria bacterium]|nr:MsnO8 family LLM class oxidoreductase [Pseudomonadota bacterium]